MKDLAFKAVMIMPSLLLQKPSKTSKSKDHLIALERRMEDWFNGDLQKLLHEGDTIQKGLQSSTDERNLNKISKQFADEMHKGNVNSAIKLLINNMESGILPLNNDTLKLLKQKHPKPAKACEDVLLPDKPESVHFKKFETIDGELVRKACMKTRRGSGPSGMDADGWRHILLSKNSGDAPNDLCKAIASVIKKLCTEKLRSNNIEALLASRLRPIGVGEVLRRITSKVVVSVLRKDAIASVGSLQVCAGHDAGCEAAVHAMHSIFDEENTEAVLLIDAGNAFNAVNRKVFLHNVRIVCLEIATNVYNCYATSARLFIFGGSELKSEEGTTQGDPIAMTVYALATIPLLLMVLEITAQFPDNSVKMVGYADDFTAGGTVTSIKKC